MATQQLAVPEQSGGALVLSPSPVFRGASMVQALEEYRELQRALDGSMPDQLMTLDGRPFRKKGYWRAIAVAFNLTVEPVTATASERSVIGELDDGTENYVYTVDYRATAPNGRSAIGDGACAASEKQRGRMKATEHNVRSHAHTRAYNRAVSNLVGFGEVSAEEVDREGHDADEPGPIKRQDGSVIVLSVDEVKGGKPGQRAWTRYDVHFDDGSRAATFDQGLAKAAEQAKADGVLCIPTVEKTARGVNLLSLTPAAVGIGPVGEALEGFAEEVGGGAIDEAEERKRLNAEAKRLGTKLNLKAAERAELWSKFCGGNSPDEVAIVYLADLVKELKSRAGE